MLILGRQSKVWHLNIWTAPGDRVPKKVRRPIFSPFQTISWWKFFFWSIICLALPTYLVPRWWVGWWLWHAGCISQDTYLLYVITCVSCITCSTCVLRVARVLRVKRVKRVLLVLLVLVVMLVSILSLLLQVLNTWFIENLKKVNHWPFLWQIETRRF